MKSNKIVKSENMPSAVLDVYEDGSGRVTFFNESNHWNGEIFLTEEQIDFYYSEVQALSLMYIPKNKKIPKVIKSSGFFFMQHYHNIAQNYIQNDKTIKRHAPPCRSNGRMGRYIRLPLQYDLS